jgi:phosphatidate phosphatase APP1
MPAGLLSRMTRRFVPLTNLSGDESVALFPSLGHLDERGDRWHVQVHGEVFAPGTVGLGKRFLLKLLQRAMKAPDADFQTELFRSRISRFLARDCKGKTIAVRCDAGTEAVTKKSRNNGHFFGALELPAAAIGPLAPSGCGNVARIRLEIVHPDGSGSLAVGQAFLLPAEGVSVISDIDDTLKHSYVACKRTLLANTFLREFAPISGMAELFRDWAGVGAAFHYVSSSPWQLYRHLAEHLAEQGFPDGSYHLRAFRLRDHLIRRILMLRRSGKAAVIRGLLQMFPRRRFVLVGDSGEADPEIYGAMARRFPRQVAGIYIRQLDGPRNSAQRYQRAFRGVRPDSVRLFREAQELAGTKPGLG